MSKTLEVVTFLSMNGNTMKAIEFYKKHLCAKVEMKVTYESVAKMGANIVVSEENKNLISHSIIKIGNTKIMLAEDTMDVKEDYKVGNNTSLCIQSADLQEINDFYEGVVSDERTRIIVPLGKIVFSEAYGIVEDPWGVQIQFMYDARLK
jgi:PhnB protein